VKLATNGKADLARVIVIAKLPGYALMSKRVYEKGWKIEV